MTALWIVWALLQGADRPHADDPLLLATVRRIAEQIESLRDEPFERSPAAVRAPDAMREVVAEIRAYNVLPRGRLAARGRGWSDLGLGGPDTPRALLMTLAVDLQGIGFDAAGNRLLVSPERLQEEDFEATSEQNPAATVLMLTGVRPDEPLVSHYLMHVRQRERAGRDPLAETTDGLLAGMAWAEGEANLVALRFLFAGMGLADEVITTRLDPGGVLDGSLLPPGLDELAAIERGLVEFVYREGFDRAVERHRAGGWSALEAAMERSRTTSDLLHPDRERSAVPVFPPPAAPQVEGLRLADEDSLGEQAIVVLISTLTGKDSLGMLAGEGWSGDRLYRWEPEGGLGARAASAATGITDWVTHWSSAQAATDFEYAFGRTLAARFPDKPLEPAGRGAQRLAVGERIFRLERRAEEVRIRVSPAAWTAADALLFEGGAPAAE